MSLIYLKNSQHSSTDLDRGLGGYLEWQMWSRRLSPYYDLKPGDRIVLVDRPLNVISWEVKVVDVVRGRYSNLGEAFALLAPLAVGTDVDQVTFEANPYSVDAKAPGWLLAWTFQPTRKIHSPRLPEHILRRNGWGRVAELVIGGGDPPATKIDEDPGQGLLQDPQLRALIENSAMQKVYRWLISIGYGEAEIRDTSCTEPYDYEVVPQGVPKFRVEVKGTQNGFGKVIVTANEVRAARSDGVRTVLAIVHSIKVSLTPEGFWSATGGSLWLDENWQAEESRLTVKQYTYDPREA